MLTLLINSVGIKDICDIGNSVNSVNSVDISNNVDSELSSNQKPSNEDATVVPSSEHATDDIVSSGAASLKTLGCSGLGIFLLSVVASF